MKNKGSNNEPAHAEHEPLNSRAVNPNGSRPGTGSSDKLPPSLTQEGSTPPAPFLTAQQPTDQPASPRIDAIFPAPLGTPAEESKERDKSSADGNSSTPSNQIPGATSAPQVPAAKSVSAKQLEANRKNSKRSTGPTSAAGKRRSSQNSYKEGLYARRLYPTIQQWAEDGGDYRTISIAVHDHYKPQGLWEGFWAEQIVTHAIRIARGIGFQQRTLAPNDRFWGTSLSTSERHVSGAFKHMLQAIKMLESLQEKRKAIPVQPHPIAADCEQGPDASKSPVLGPSESSETEEASTGQNEHPADTVDFEEGADAGCSDDGQEEHGFLYDGPPDQSVVPSSQPGRGAGGAGQQTRIGGTKSSVSHKSDPAAGGVRKGASEPPHLMADIVDAVQLGLSPSELFRSVDSKNVGTNSPVARQAQDSAGSASKPATVPKQPQGELIDLSNDRNSKSEPVPSVGRIENVGTKPNVPGNVPNQADLKRDPK
jgi:hypothetical protein